MMAAQHRAAVRPMTVMLASSAGSRPALMTVVEQCDRTRQSRRTG